MATLGIAAAIGFVLGALWKKYPAFARSTSRQFSGLGPVTPVVEMATSAGRRAIPPRVIASATSRLTPL